jgi:hypothetical protein
MLCIQKKIFSKYDTMWPVQKKRKPNIPLFLGIPITVTPTTPEGMHPQLLKYHEQKDYIANWYHFLAHGNLIIKYFCF